jgi:glycosyltransferase involved in cell wall biosynthesis
MVDSTVECRDGKNFFSNYGMIDVVLLTKNSERYVRSCLRGIKQGVSNLGTLFVIDGYSKDNTLNIVKDEVPSAKIFEEDQGLWYARLLGISLVHTPFFAFVDSDVILPRNWSHKLLRYLDNDQTVGAVQSFIIEVGWEPYARFGLKGYRKKMRKRLPKEVKERGFTGATLIRTQLIKNVYIPRVPCHEDYFILKEILDKGYKWLEIPVIAHQVFKPWREQAFVTSAVIRSIGYRKLRDFLFKAVIHILSSIRYAEPLMLIYYLRKDLAKIKGYLKWSDFINEEFPT